MFEGNKRALLTVLFSLGLLLLAGCYTQVKLFTRVSEEPPAAQEQEERVAPEYHYYYYYHYGPGWDEPYWFRSRFYWPSYLRWRSYWDYWDWCETYYWYEPCWDDLYWVRVYHSWYSPSYYGWGYYDYPGYYYWDPWWGQRYYRQEKPQPTRRRGYDRATSRTLPEIEKTVTGEETSLWIRSRPESRSEKRGIGQQARRATEVKKAVERKRSRTSTEENGEKKKQETSKRRRKPDSKEVRQR